MVKRMIAGMPHCSVTGTTPFPQYQMRSFSKRRLQSPPILQGFTSHKLLPSPLPVARPLTIRRRLSRPTPKPTADAACEALLQAESPEGGSESASLLIDQKQINEALRTYCTSTLSSSPRKSSIPSDPYIQKLTLAVVSTHASCGKEDLIHVGTRSSSLRALLAERLNIERKLKIGESGLMLSPAKKGVWDALRKTGDRRMTERMRSMEVVKSVSSKDSSECRRRTVGKWSEGESALLLMASKGERVIRSSKVGKLLKCFKEDVGWLTVR